MQLVFASGFLFPQRIFGIEYFRGLQQRFVGSEHQALFPAVPVAGTVEARAAVLAAAIQANYPAGPVHIIAHSMAGLDCRALIGANMQGLGEPGRIASLTTLATPHRGSPVADLLAGPQSNGKRRVLYDAITQAARPLGIDAGALASLTAEAASNLPDIARTHPHIRCRSYAGTGRPGARPTAFNLAITYRQILQDTGQPNDGLVTQDSASYGEFQEAWPCDHADMVGHNFDTADLGFFKFDHFAAIDGIIRRLAAE